MNYFKDHTKLIVGGERQFIVTYINSERQSRSWSLPDLARRGALPQVRFYTILSILKTKIKKRSKQPDVSPVSN